MSGHKPWSEIHHKKDEPRQKWDETGTDFARGVVWWTKLDNRYQVEVVQNGDTSGQLSIYDHDDEDRLLKREQVPVNYGAEFGPDVEDVHAWKTMVMEFVDKELGT